MPSKQKRSVEKRKTIYVMGNWKMNPATADEARRIIALMKKVAPKLSSTRIVIFPPAVFSALAIGRNPYPFSVGVQNIFTGEIGSYTGEISAPMVKSVGIDYVLLGHSERRALGETDGIVAQKAISALQNGLKVVICVGEKERDHHGSYLEPLTEQIQNSLAGIEKKDFNRVIIAYEPVWAIGAKEALSSALIYEMSLFVKKVLADIFGQELAVKTPILYGGSVNFRNAVEIIQEGHVDGLLVGRESVNPPSFIDMLKAVDAIERK